MIVIVIVRRSCSSSSSHSSSGSSNCSSSSSSSSSSTTTSSSFIDLMLLELYREVTAKLFHLKYKFPDPLPPIGGDKRITLDSFTPRFCYNELQFKYEVIAEMLNFFNFPVQFHVAGSRHVVHSETAFLILLYRLSHYEPYEKTLRQGLFNRSGPELSVIFNFMIRYITQRYRHCVVANLLRYSNRFDLYNQAIGNFLVNHPDNHSPNRGLPQDCLDLVGFIDGTSHPVARPSNNAMQNVVWNKHYFKHQLIHQVITFPDGMAVLESAVGYINDNIAWNTSKSNDHMFRINMARFQNNMPSLKLYGDSIYRSGLSIRGAYAERDGPRSEYQILSNFLRSKARICVEWTFNTIKLKNDSIKHISTQQLMKSIVRGSRFSNMHIAYSHHF